MRFSILHTSARPDKWEEIRTAWLNAADHPGQVEYILVVDRRWRFGRLPVFPDRSQDRALWNTGRRCYVDGVNIAAAYSTGDVLIVNADDQYPCEHWDTELLKVILGPTYTEEAALQSEFVVEVNTLTPAEHDRGILVMPILSRARYQRLGYVFYPAYESMYADADFCEQVRYENRNPRPDGTVYCGDDVQGILLNARHLTFPHRHPIFDPSQSWDWAYEEQNRRSSYALGSAILAKRRESNFSAAVDIVVHERAEKRRSIACMLPGEWFSQAWVGAWTDIVCTLNDTWVTYIQFGHCSNVYFARQAMSDAIQSLKPELLLWIDDDQILTLDGLRLLLSDLDAHPELDGVAGWAWCQPNTYDNGPMLSCGHLAEDGTVRRFTYEELMAGQDDLKPISYSGFPAVLMRNTAIEKAGRRAFLPILDEQHFPPYGMSGEDAAFFFHARLNGSKFAVDRRVKVPHLKLRCAEPVQGSSLEVAAAPASIGSEQQKKG